MIVTIVDRARISAEWDHPGPFRVHLATVEIADTCPVCGKPRGKPARRRFCEDGVFYHADIWTNACGHVDYYKDVIKEGKIIGRDVI